MKKFLSFIIAASMSVSAMVSTAVFAENTTPAVSNMVVLGDSISSGYGLDKNEYSYAQFCADYLGCNLDNFAADGMSSSELCDMLKNANDTQKQSIKNSEVVVISIGGNDIIHCFAKQILNFAAQKNLLKEGYTAEDIPEDAGASAMNQMLDRNAFKEYVKTDRLAALAINTELKAFSMNLRLTEGFNAYGANQGIIKNEIMTNIKESVGTIKEINPDAQIIVQTVYQPFQFSPDYISKNYADSSSYSSMLTVFREDMNDIMVCFREELQKVEDIEIADVLQTFTALENVDDTSDATPGYAYYFTDIQEPREATEEGGKTTDLHPNQKGHVAIASTVINKIKVKDSITGEMVAPTPAVRDIDPTTEKEIPTLLDTTLNNITDIAYCPPLAMEQIVEAVPERLVPGDVNADGLIDAGDASAILSEYANLSTIGAIRELDEEATKKADINYDGIIDAADATYASMYYAYLSTLQEGEEVISIFQYMNKEQTDMTSNK